MKVKYMYLMEMVITQFEQMMDYLTIERAGSYVDDLKSLISFGTPCFIVR